MIDLVDEIVDDFKKGKEKIMPVASSIGSGLAFGATNAAANAIASDGVEHIMNALGALTQNETFRELMKGAGGLVKQSVPKFGGFGVVEEMEFHTALNLLSIPDQHRVARVVKNIRDHNEKHIQRWWTILAFKKVEGQKWDPAGPMIVPSQKKKADEEKDAWGLPKKPKAQAKATGPVEIEGTPADSRVIALQNVADMVNQPPVATIVGDSDEAVEFVAEHLRNTILRDYHFYNWLVKWWNGADEFRSNLKKADEYAKAQFVDLMRAWISSEIGEANLEKILSNGSLDAHRRKLAIEKLLRSNLRKRWDMLGTRKLSQGPAGLMITFCLLVFAGVLLLSLDDADRGMRVVMLIILAVCLAGAGVMLRRFHKKGNSL